MAFRFVCELIVPNCSRHLKKTDLMYIIIQVKKKENKLLSSFTLISHRIAISTIMEFHVQQFSKKHKKILKNSKHTQLSL